MKRNIFRSIAVFLIAIFGFGVAACGKNDKKTGDAGESNAFGMRGASEIVLVEDYETAWTEAFKFDGVGAYDFVAVKLDDDFGGKLYWNDDSQKLQIREGLVKGEYSTTMTATLIESEGEEELEFPFTVKVVLPEIPSGSPKIAGEGFQKVYADYAAFSTERFSLYGTGVSVRVSKVKKDGEAFEQNAFVWNGAERKLQISAGLGVGVYAVTLTASSTDSQYEAYDFVYNFVVQETVTPVINGPTSLTIGEGYLSGSLGGFILIGTDVEPFVTVTEQSGAFVDGAVSYDKAKDSLEFAAGLAAGTYTVAITLSNGNTAQDVAHELSLTVKKGETVTGSFSYASKGFASDEVVGTAKEISKDFTYPVTISGSNYAASLVAGEYEVTLESKYFVETNKRVTVENGSVNGGELVFTTPRLSGNASYLTDGFTFEAENKVYYQMAGATASEGFVVSYAMSVSRKGGDAWVSGGFCFKIGSVWYSMLVFPDTRASGEANVKIFFTQGASGQFVNGGYALIHKSLSSSTASIYVEIAFYDGAFYVCVSEPNADDEPYAVRIGAEFFEEYACNSDCASVYFPNQANFDYCHEGKENRAKIDVEKFFGNAERALGFRSTDNKNEFTNVRYALGDAEAKAAIAEMKNFAKTCEHSGVWAE